MGLLRLIHGVCRCMAAQDPNTGNDVSQLGDSTNNAMRVNVVAGSIAASTGLPIYDAFLPPVASTWTNATALNTALTVTTGGMDTVALTFVPSGTISSGIITFEVYDGASWLPTRAARVSSYNTDPTYALNGGSQAWQLPVAGFTQARVRLSTVIGGTGTATLTALVSSTPDVSIVTVGLDPSSGIGSGTAAGSITTGFGNAAQVTDSAGNSRPLAVVSTVADPTAGVNAPWRNNLDVTVATLTAVTTSGTTADQTNFNGRGLQLGINVTALSGTSPTLTVTIQGKDAASGQYYTLLVSAAIVATGFTLLTVYPGAPSTANVSSPQVLPRTWRLSYTITGTTPSVTATLGASVIV